MAGHGSVLLPSSDKDFSSKEFWEKFFRNRGSKSFEWYGEYTTLCSVLHKYIKMKDKLLVVGCGNSSLGGDLYDFGHCRHITSIDNSAVAIRQMTQKYKKTRPEMEFLLMDATSMPDFADASFSCALDKATLDAIYSNESQRDIAEKMLLEIGRLLSIGGRYIIISLAQEHILKLMCSVFCRENSGWLIRVLVVPQAPDSDLQLPVFTFVFTKCISNPRLPRIIEVQNPGAESLTRLGSIEELSVWVTDLQEAAMVCQSVTPEKEGRVTFQNHLGQTTYTCFLVQRRQHMNLPFAVFVVPFGKHSDPAFSSPAARREVLEAVTCDRLLLVMLHPEVYYESSEAVKASLSRVVMRYAPRRADISIREADVQILSSGTIYPSQVLDERRTKDGMRLIVEEIEGWGRRVVADNCPEVGTLGACFLDRAEAHARLWIEAGRRGNGAVLTAGVRPVFPKRNDRKGLKCWIPALGDLKTSINDLLQEYVVGKKVTGFKVLPTLDSAGPFKVIVWRGGDPPDSLRHALSSDGLLVILGNGLESWGEPAVTYTVTEAGIDVRQRISLWGEDMKSAIDHILQMQVNKDENDVLSDIRRALEGK